MTRKIDARSIFTLVLFFAVSAAGLDALTPDVLVIFPLRVRLPRRVGRGVSRAKAWLLGSGGGEGGGGGGEVANTLPRETTETAEQETERKETPQLPPITRTDTRSVLSSRPNDTYLVLGLASAPVAGVLLLLASTCIPGSVVRGGIVSSGGVRPYDIMTLFISFAYISLSLDCTGLLRYLAFIVASRSSSSGPALFTALYGLFVVLSLVVGNDPVVLSGTPFVAYFTSLAGITPPTAFLFAQFQSANLASALLVSSNPTNLVLTSSFHLSFLSFSAWTALPTVAAAVVLYPTLRWTFRRHIPHTISAPQVDPRAALTDPFGAVFTTTIFLTCIVLLIALSAVGLLEGVQGVWAVTGPAALLVLARDIIHDLRHSSPATTTHPVAYLRHRLPTISTILARLPLPLLPFAFSMFILVDALQHTGWVTVFAHWWSVYAHATGTAGCIFLMGVLSVLGCNVGKVQLH